MQRIGLLAVLAMATVSAQAEDVALTDRGMMLQVKDWMINDAFSQGDENFSVGYIRPYYAWQPNLQNLYFIKGNLYASNRTGADQSSISSRREARYFAEIPEFWWRHSFDEARQQWIVGMQKFDDQGGLWWDAPLTGLSYRFDSSLLKGYLAAGDRSSYLRTDWDVEDPQATSALYAIGQLSWQWKLDHFLILRSAYRQDKDNEYIVGQAYTNAEMASRPIEGVWADMELRGEQRSSDEHWPHYEVEGAWMQGQRVEYGTTPQGADNVLVKGRSDSDLQGYFARFGFDYVWQYNTRWVLGVDALYASGGGGDGVDGGFVQTGLNTNRNVLYTTNLSGSLTGEALRMTISNIQIIGAHAAFSYQNRHEGFIAVRQAWRADANDEVLLDTRLPANGSTNLGLEVDIAYGWYMPVVGQRRGLEVGEFKGKQFMVYASHFEPDFSDPGTRVDGTVVGGRFIWAF